MSEAAANGALIGLMIGMVQYFIALFVMQKVVTREMAEAKEAKEEMPGMESLAAIIKRIKWILMLVSILIYPAIGYAAGRYLGG